jgi:hypothetical protein
MRYDWLYSSGLSPKEHGIATQIPRKVKMQLQSPDMHGMILSGRLKMYSSIIGLPLAFWASRKPRRTQSEELRFHQFMREIQANEH